MSGELQQFDDAVAAELKRVSHVEYDAHEICKHFAGELRKRLAVQPQSVGDAWVKWNRSKPFPPEGRYLVTDVMGDEFVALASRFYHDGVIAYLPTRLPDPYIEADGRQG